MTFPRLVDLDESELDEVGQQEEDPREVENKKEGRVSRASEKGQGMSGSCTRSDNETPTPVPELVPESPIAQSSSSPPASDPDELGAGAPESNVQAGISYVFKVKPSDDCRLYYLLGRREISTPQMSLGSHANSKMLVKSPLFFISLFAESKELILDVQLFIRHHWL
ncbi:hypothetical protein M569_00389 [Genlisea aurea]|uniref:Uncharacterized protein n=1 Tax=Genlisea aurea TaxID=192259 RepID=S8ENG9_9LAMI|nr:hypothetical protein M569_00389 [Genlisea aurea]